MPEKAPPFCPPDSLVPALDLLGKEPWVYEAAIFGDGLHVIGREGVDVEKEIAVLFQGHRIGVRRMEWIRSSLEDVFVSLIDKEENR